MRSILSATPSTRTQTIDNANKILTQLRGGASFAGYARQYSEASTAAVGGDLGWVRPEQLPARSQPCSRMPAGSISNPIPVPGGFSIIAIQDTRKILTADPRDAVLSLKQVSIAFPKGATARGASRSSRASLRPPRPSAAAVAPTSWQRISMPRSSAATG